MTFCPVTFCPFTNIYTQRFRKDFAFKWCQIAREWLDILEVIGCWTWHWQYFLWNFKFDDRKHQIYPILFPHQSMYAMPNHLPIICQNLIIWKLSPRFTYPSEFGISVWRGSYIYIYICTKTGIIIYHWIAVTNIHVIQKVTLSKLYVKPYNIPTSLNEMSTIFMNQYFYSQIKMFHKTSRTIHPSDWEIKQKI